MVLDVHVKCRTNSGPAIVTRSWQLETIIFILIRFEIEWYNKTRSSTKWHWVTPHQTCAYNLPFPDFRSFSCSPVPEGKKNLILRLSGYYLVPKMSCTIRNPPYRLDRVIVALRKIVEFVFFWPFGDGSTIQVFSVFRSSRLPE